MTHYFLKNKLYTALKEVSVSVLQIYVPEVNFIYNW